MTTIWHNQQCSKSREAMEILTSSGAEITTVKYLQEIPTVNQIKEVLKMLGVSAREMMRTKEEIYKELNLKDETSEEKLIEAMHAHPRLIERPIVIKDGKAIIARPASRLQDF